MVESSVSAPSRRTPGVVVVVLNWCREAAAARCLRSLEVSSYPRLEVVLVDNASPDGSGERLHARFPEVTYLRNPTNLGYAGGNNRGIERALEDGADYVLVLNDDAEVEPDAVARLVRTAEAHRPHVGTVVPKILYHHDPSSVWYGGGRFSPLLGLGIHEGQGAPDRPDASERPREVTFATGCCLLLSAEAARDTGGFDERYFAYLEDAELCLRLRRRGYSVVYEPRARVLHEQPPLGADPSPFQIVQRDRNRRRLMSEHFRWTQRLPFLLRFHLTRPILLLRYLVGRDPIRARAILRGWLSPARSADPAPAP